MIDREIGHYRITELLGEGGMGVVYKAHDTRLRRSVALKFLPARLLDDPATRKRFLREARSASAIQHPNVCTIHEIGETPDGQMFICMDHYEGRTLDRILAEGGVALETALDIVIQVADGLAKAHETGITHRDVKPANVLVTADGIPKLLDFGLAKLGDDTRVTESGVALGTVAYMSPEQVKGEATDSRTDVWSLGVLLYELLTGELPFPGEQAATVMYGIVNADPPPLARSWPAAPPVLQAIIDSALRKARDERFPSAAALMAALIGAEAETCGTRRRRHSATSRYMTSRSVVRHRRLTGVVVSLVLLSSLAAFVVSRFASRSEPRPVALAVMDFSDLGEAENSTRTAGMAGLLHVGFVQNVAARVVSPDYLRDVGRRMFGADKGPIADSQVLQVAKESGADLMLAGQFAGSGDARYVVWRLVDVRTGEIVGASRLDDGDPLAVADGIVAEVAGLLTRAVGAEGGAAVQSVRDLTTQSREAHEFFVAAMIAAKEYRREEAVDNFRQAIAADSTFALAYFELANIQHALVSTFGEALANADQAWRLRSRLSVKDRMRLEAFRLQATYKVEAATDVYRELAARWPDDYEIQAALFRQLYFWWSFEEALEVARRALALFPDDAFFASFEAPVLTLLGQSDAAVVSARSFVARFPDRSDGIIRLVDSFLQAGLPDSAEIWARLALESEPSKTAAEFRLGIKIPYRRGDLLASLEGCERMLADEGLSDYWAGMLRSARKALCFEAGRYDRVLALFDQDPPGDRISAFYAERARVGYLLRMNRAQEALTWTEALMESLQTDADTDEDPRYVQYLGIARWTARDHRASALADLDSLAAAAVAADELDASSKEFGAYARRSALLVMLRIALNRGNAAAAQELLQQLKAVGGHASDWYNRLARLEAKTHALRGDQMAAERVLRDHVRLYPAHALGHYELARFLDAADRPRESTQSYARFLELWAGADAGLPELAVARSRLAALQTLD